MISVAVAGFLGRMGSAVVDAVGRQDDMEVVCGVDPNDHASQSRGFPAFKSLEEALEGVHVDVLVDFTEPRAVEKNIEIALSGGVNCVIGTTGLSTEKLEALSRLAKDDACLFFAPNFTTGAVLMMQFAKIASPFFEQAEIVEFHHCNKKDSPSGTAMQTARLISEARGAKPSMAPGRETEVDGMQGARGAFADGIPVHSVRSSGFVADQEVILGSYGQTLTIKHDSWDRESYMPGVILSIRSVMGEHGLIIGLENFMNIG